jgi:pimeloyl-ACP methyl ester carboxylesterase
VLFVTRLLLVHGSLTGSARSWGRQCELADEFELAAPDRPGFHPGPPVDRVDFEADARWLRSVVRRGDHLVAHSYGAVVALVAAQSLPLRSLVVIEPPAFSVARGNPVVEAWLARADALPRDNPRAHAAAFLRLVGAPFMLPDDLPPDLEQGVEALFRERHPTHAEVPLAPLPYPTLVVTGDHDPAFEAVGDVLERELGAERLVLPGGGHAVQTAPGFNEALLAFLRRA